MKPVYFWHGYSKNVSYAAVWERLKGSLKFWRCLHWDHPWPGSRGPWVRKQSFMGPPTPSSHTHNLKCLMVHARTRHEGQLEDPVLLLWSEQHSHLQTLRQPPCAVLASRCGWSLYTGWESRPVRHHWEHDWLTDRGGTEGWAAGSAR